MEGRIDERVIWSSTVVIGWSMVVIGWSMVVGGAGMVVLNIAISHHYIVG